MVRLQFRRSGESDVPLQCHYSQVNWKVPVRILFMGQIDLFKNNSYLIKICTTKKPIRNNYTKNVNINI